MVANPQKIRKGNLEGISINLLTKVNIRTLVYGISVQ